MTLPSIPLEEVLKDLAPNGEIRAAINIANTALAQANPTGGSPTGISVELAYELGRRMGAPVRLVIYPSAGKVLEAFDRSEWDVAFLAVDPDRATKIAFTSPYLTIEGTYLVRADAAFVQAADLDVAGTRIAVARNAAYDLFLTRALKLAALVRVGDPAGAIDLFNSGEVDAVAGVRQVLDLFAKSVVGVRVLSDRFMAIQQAMATPKANVAGAGFLQEFIEAIQASGFLDRLNT